MKGGTTSALKITISNAATQAGCRAANRARRLTAAGARSRAISGTFAISADVLKTLPLPGFFPGLHCSLNRLTGPRRFKKPYIARDLAAGHSDRAFVNRRNVVS